MMSKNVNKTNKLFIDEFREALEYVLKKQGVSEETLKKCRGKNATICIARKSPKFSTRMLYWQALLYLEDKWSKEENDLQNTLISIINGQPLI